MAIAYCVLWNDYSIDIRSMPDFETARVVGSIAEHSSTRVKHTIAVVSEVCRNLPEEAIFSVDRYCAISCRPFIQK